MTIDNQTPRNKPIKKWGRSKVLLVIGLSLVLVGMAQVLWGPEGTINVFIFPGVLLMLLAALMPKK